MGKNSKKKSKSRPPETGKGVIVGNGEVSQPENHDSSSERNFQKQNLSDDGESQSVGFQESDAEAEKHGVHAVGQEIKTLEEQKIVQSKEEAEFQEQFRKLKDEIFNCVQKEESLQMGIEALQNQRDIFSQKESEFQEQLQNLKDEICNCIQKEEKLQRKIEELMIEKDLSVQKEAMWETKFQELRSQLESCLLEEELGKKAMLRLESMNCRLQVQVNELEESRDRLVHENGILLNSISLLQVRVQQLEYTTSKENAEKENDSDEKTSMADLNLASSNAGFSSSSEPEKDLVPDNNLMQYGDSSGHTFESRLSSEPEKELVQGNHLMRHDDSSVQAFESIPIHDATNRYHLSEEVTSVDTSRSMALPQVPREDEIQVEEDDIKIDDSVTMLQPDIPLTDAPLIGAPFRLISFFAKYVSGADLVKEQGSKVGS